MSRSLVILAASLVELGSAAAHEIGISFGTYRTEGSSVRAELTFAEKELTSFVQLDSDKDDLLSGAEIDAAKPKLEESLLSQVVLQSKNTTCDGSIEGLERVESDGFKISARFKCPNGVDVVTVDLRFLDQATPGHRHLVQARSAGSPLELIAYRGQSSFKFAADDAAAPEQQSGVGGLFLLGIQHILEGVDHLLFLLGLLLIGGKLRTLIGVITSFTLAHSVTLGLAVLGVWAPSGSFVEPAIALSVAYVAIENWFIQDATKRWRIAFLFGLLHGFGFAGALGQLNVPPGDVPLALLLFNLGVETGQLGVLAVILPPILWARRKEGFRIIGVRAISAGIAMFGVYWFVTRVAEALA